MITPSLAQASIPDKRRVRLPHNFVPRWYQRAVLEAFDEGVRRFVAVWPRRHGKDKTFYNLMVREAATGRIGNYYYVFPTFTEGWRALWDNTDNGFRVVDHCPPVLISGRNETRMHLTLKNGSTIQVLGSSDIDSLRGPNPCGVVFSEYSVQSPQAWQVIKPILIENEGWAAFNFTPRGNNHAFDLLEEAKDDPTWFTSHKTVDDLGILSAAQLAEARKGTSEEFFRQEYYCDFEAGNEGSYYGRLLASAKDEGRIGRVAADPALPVHTSWDLGVGDATAIWFFQVVGRERRYVDFCEASGEGLPYYMRVLQSKGYVYGRHFAPHDIEVREWLQEGKSRLEVARTLGIRFEVIPQHPVEDRHEAARLLIPRCWFDAERCKDGIAALRAYHKAFDDKRQTWRDRPEHDWASHGADAFGYGAMVEPSGPGIRTPAASSSVPSYGRRW
jgi:phage terminase large subunit